MTLIYHITHIQNLPGILAENGLWCDTEKDRRQLHPVGIAHAHIKARRARRVVTTAAGGFVANYVPFYFCPRSPMLYAIHKNYVAGYQGGQSAIVHLVSSLEAVQARGIPFTFTDGSAEVEISSFYTEIARLDQLDWKVINSWSWKNTEADNDRKRRKQAEFLAHHFFPWDLVHEIGVFNLSMLAQVVRTFENSSHKPVVKVQRGWYYDA